jgi:hypothetical protein
MWRVRPTLQRSTARRERRRAARQQQRSVRRPPRDSPDRNLCFLCGELVEGSPRRWRCLRHGTPNLTPACARRAAPHLRLGRSNSDKFNAAPDRLEQGYFVHVLNKKLASVGNGEMNQIAGRYGSVSVKHVVDLERDNQTWYGVQPDQCRAVRTSVLFHNLGHRSQTAVDEHARVALQRCVSGCLGCPLC